MSDEDGAVDVAAACGELGDPARLLALAESGLDARADPEMEAYAERVRRWLRVPVALVSLVRADEQVFPGAAGLAGPWAGRRRTPLTHSFCRHVVLGGSPLVIEDARDDPRVATNLAVPDLGVIAYAGMPLRDAAGRVLGSLCAIDHEPRAWTPADLEALADLAAGCSAELRLRLARVDADRERTRRDALELGLHDSLHRSQILLDVSRSVGDNTSAENVGARLTDLADRVLGADYVALLRVEGDDLRLLSPSSEGREALRGVWDRVPLDENAPSTRAVHEQRVVTCSSRAEFDREFSPEARARLDSVGLEAVIAAPVADGRGTAGALVLGWRRPREFSAPDLLLVRTAAAYTARAMDHVGWVQHRVAAAQEMQRAMLSELPEVPGLALAARYRPADDRHDVGGDWYDATVVSDPARPRDTVVALSVGDIVGHELAAAVVMGQVRSMLRQATWDRTAGPPSATMRAFETANHGVGLHAAGSALLAYLRRDESGGPWSMTWVNAGHPPPLLVLADGTVRSLEGHERWFGLPRATVPDRRDRTVDLPDGSTLVLVTDGAIERRGEDVDRRVEALSRTVARWATADPETLVDVLVDDVREGADDDIVLLVVRVGGLPG